LASSFESQQRGLMNRRELAPEAGMLFVFRDDATQSFGSRSRASDDIEIHIGRIEVAAIQAPSIRPAPAKTPRRAASLDEYLKRRDGITS